MRRYYVIIAILLLLIAQEVIAQNIEPEEVEFISDDGVLIKATYYQPIAPRKRYYPAILILPEFRQSRRFWDKTATVLAEKGFIILVIDFRGQGESTQAGEAKLDWAFFTDAYIRLFLLDVRASIEYLRKFPRVDTYRISIMGAGLGANVGLIFASKNNRIQGLMLLSPGLRYRGLETEEAIIDYGNRPLLMIVSEDDSYSLHSSEKLYSLAQGEKELKVYSNAGRGAKMLSRKPEILDVISNWLKEQFD